MAATLRPLYERTAKRPPALARVRGCVPGRPFTRPSRGDPAGDAGGGRRGRIGRLRTSRDLGGCHPLRVRPALFDPPDLGVRATLARLLRVGREQWRTTAL